MTRVQAALLGGCCAALMAILETGLAMLLWSAWGALSAHRPRGWDALACVALGAAFGGPLGWQVGKALAHEPEPPGQAPAPPVQPPPAPAARPGWVTRVATTRDRLWPRKGRRP